MSAPRMPLIFLAMLGLLGAISNRVHAQETAALQEGGAAINVHFDSMPAPAFRKVTLEWITRAAHAVSVYYARFPVDRVEIYVHTRKGRSVGPGTASGEDGAHIDVTLGSDTTEHALAQGGNNWLMTHEMVHLALPGVQEQHHWLEEGLATYVEPIARVRAGELTPEQVWNDMAQGMPNGEPEKGDRGLDRTPTWGRTYWGGAMFCLLADVEIRKKTHNTMGLETALRKILSSGGSIEKDWDIERVLETGDTAVGAPVLVTLYNKMKDDPQPADLNALWVQLGVREGEHAATLDDTASLAAIRRAIMTP